MGGKRPDVNGSLTYVNFKSSNLPVKKRAAYRGLKY